MNIKLTKSQIEDISFFVEMENKSDASSFVNPQNSEEHLAAIRREEILYLNIVVDEIIAGFFILAIEDDGKVIEFRRIVVDGKGRGIGQKAISAMEEYCRTMLGAAEMWLDVYEYNERGIHIYRKLGFCEFKTEEHPKGRVIFMKKRL